MTATDYQKEFFKHNKLNACLSLLVYIGNALLNIGMSWYIQVIIDLMSETSALTFTEVSYLFLGLVLVMLMMIGVQYIAQPRFLERALNQYKEQAFKKLLEKNLASFADESEATYLSALTNDVVSIEDNYLKNIFQMVQLLVVFIGALILMLYYNITLTFVAILLSGLPFLVSLLAGNTLALKERQVSDQNEAYVAGVKDILAGFSVVKSFHAEKEIAQLFTVDNQALEATKKSRNQTLKFIEGVSNLAQVFAQVGVMLTGAWFVLRGHHQLTAGMVLAFTNLMHFIVQPLATVPQLLAQRRAALGLIEKLASNLTHNVNETGTHLVPTGKNPPVISLKGVNFSYSADEKVLQDINFQFEPGKSYAIVGGSGSGKSTLLNLLMGMAADYEGSIQINQQELRKLNMTSLYQTVAHIQQNVFIFNATIYDNMTLFKDFPHTKVQAVTEAVGLSDLIAERGKIFLAGENGCHLSGGERQRVAIARALLRESSVLLVDEATSALDNRTAHQINDILLHLSALTRIIVTHQLHANVLRQYDEILVLKDGALCEHGTFDELMAAKEYFYSLYVVTHA